jgi:serine/threonine-protein kinase
MGGTARRRAPLRGARVAGIAMGALLVAALLSGCARGAETCAPSSGATCASPTATAARTAAPAATPRPTPTLGPARYTPVVLAHGFGMPDDLTLDAAGDVLFADQANGSVNRLAPDGHVTTLASGLPETEGIIAEGDGSLLVAVQGQDGQGIDRILRLTPGGAAPHVFASFANATGKAGLDGISVDPRTGDILAADSPNGVVYRVSADGRHITPLARGFVRPTDAIADAAGNVYVADEYGNSVARIAADGSVTKLASVPLADDLAFDVDGTLLVTALNGDTLVRLDPATGKQLAVVAGGLHEPQGLAVDAAGNLYVSEQLGNVIVELRRG